MTQSATRRRLERLRNAELACVTRSRKLVESQSQVMRTSVAHPVWMRSGGNAVNGSYNKRCMKHIPGENMEQKSCIGRALAIAIISIATTLGSTASLAQSADSGALNQTITFKQPRVTGKGFIALKRFATNIAPSKKNSYRLERVGIDVYINPLSDEFTRTAGANMGNEIARHLVRWGVPREKISYATKPEERPRTVKGTYDVELRAIGSRS
jgi:hypothetical protein